ncbi:MAG: helix-turn-helix domain-containing protein [Ktedonobacteraceae bacterium]|jgi:DNA-binding Xre family transcriptional regulator
MARLRIKEVAEERGYTMSSLSRKADISLRNVRRLWRNPETVTTTDTLEKLARALEVNIGDLVEDVTPRQ